MNNAFGDLIGSAVNSYIDNFVICAKILEDHEWISDGGMKTLRFANLQLQPEKCGLARGSVFREYT